MLALLTRAGFRKRASQTALEFVESLRQERFAGTLLVQRITNAYQANVFGGRPWDQAEAGRWLAELKPLVVAHAVASSAAVVTA